jgi:hypothetical protein
VATDEVEEAVLAGGAADVVEDVTLIRLSVVGCVGLCARTAINMSVSVAARASGVDIVEFCVLRRSFTSEV